MRASIASRLISAPSRFLSTTSSPRTALPSRPTKVCFRRRHIRAFDMAPNGTLARQTDRVFAELGGSEPGVPDGMKVDVAGNVYCGGSGGIWILDAKGEKLGRIVHGQPQTTNLAFGGADWKTLYFTNWNY